MYPGKPLPKKVLRPFICRVPAKLNKNEYVILSNSDKSIILDRLSFPGYGLGVLALIAWLVLDLSDFSNLYIAVGFISISFIMHVSSKLMKPGRYLIFNRKKSLISIPKGIFSNKRIEGPWDEWSARISSAASSVGMTRKNLLLVHIPSKTMLQIDTTPTTIDSLLGYWSFIVQYMSGGPLPNVPELEGQINLTDGLGSWEQWEKAGKYEHDPYEEWLQQLKADPSLDVAYRDF